MSENPDVFVKSMKEGIERVKSSPFALIVERKSAELMIGSDCDLTYIEDRSIFMPRQFAIALPKNSPHLEKFNSAIRQLKSRRRMHNLVDRYRKSCGVLKGVTVRVSSHRYIESDFIIYFHQYSEPTIC